MPTFLWLLWLPVGALGLILGLVVLFVVLFVLAIFAYAFCSLLLLILVDVGRWTLTPLLNWRVSRIMGAGQLTDDDDHVTGYKWAYIGLDEDSRAQILPLRRRGSYRSEATFTCTAKKKCNKPTKDCHCGFHAARFSWLLGKLMGSGIRFSERRRIVLLTVDLHGHVIEGSLGFRAEKQRVLSIGVAPFCSACSRWEKIAAVGLSPSGAYHPPKTLAPVCQLHAGQKFFTLDWLANQLGTEVRWSASAPPR